MLKRLIWVTALLVASTGALSAQTTVQQPDCLLTLRAPVSGTGFAVISAVGTSALYDNRGSGCTDWTLTYNTFGFSAATLQIVDAPNNNGTAGTVVAFQGTIVGGGTQPVTASISGGFSSGIISVSGYYPYMGVSLVSKTGTGSLQGTLYGWRRASTSATPIVLSTPTMANGIPVALGESSGGVNVAIIADQCQTSQGLTVSGSISTSTTIITGTAGKLITICGQPYIYVNGTATSWAMVEGTGTLCVTNLAANFGGGTTASAGPNFIANQGQMLGANSAAYISTRAADNICLLLSAANQVNYTVRYVVQ